MNKKGFTLIELLVVIAIIGILSGTVIVSMSGAQDSAKDARIKSSLGQLRTATEVYRFSNDGDYDNINMWSEPSIATLLADLDSPTRSATSDAWCVSKALSDGTNWCVSNTGTSGAG
ncbi:MAG: type pilus assembly protein PilA, partial [Patescibacteria group bacterium]|nr:type pilus assembly protein PilA [Patescibacteria group bacterium]